MKRDSLFLAAVLCFFSIGCPTPYEEAGLRGGYRDLQIKPGVFYVQVNGNGFTPEITLVGYFHQRAGELCRRAGFSDYSVLSEAHSSESQNIELGKSYTGTTSGQLYGNTYTGQTTVQEHGGGTISVTRYQVSGYVGCLTANTGRVSDTPAAVPRKNDSMDVPTKAAPQIPPVSPVRKQSGYCVTVALKEQPRVYCYPTLEECQGSAGRICKNDQQCGVLSSCDPGGD
ncbi:MAG: hypothetical protein HYT87_04015 [Nitrospirae bacterium]|nr:hypothetical protein [Nitrospirota bacterium]